jgi:adenine/guanine/hypoxanthine permease
MPNTGSTLERESKIQTAQKPGIIEESRTNRNFLTRFFKLDEKNTTIKTEIVAGLTTFITMAYIIFVNSAFLADAGIPREAAIAATIISSAFASILMGLYANFPIALAPGLGLNAYFTYTVVKSMGIPWETALGAVFISGFIFFLLAITRTIQTIIKAIPQFLISAISVGIGLFIAFIGFKNAGIIVNNPDTSVALGNLRNPSVLLALLGLVFTSFLVVRRVKGSFLIGIIAITLLTMVFNINNASFPQTFHDIISTPPNIMPTLLKLNIAGAIGMGLINIIFSFTFVDLFDNIGTFMGVTRKAGMIDETGNVPGMNKALLCDSFASMFGAAVGTSTTTSYVESAAGIEEGGRSGLTAVTVGLLFLAALFLTPVVKLVPSFAIAPVLIIIGVFMMSEVVNIKFEDFTEALPAFLTIVLMPLTFSIAQGIAFGFTAYALMKTFSGKWKEVSPTMYILTALFIIQFAFFKTY